MQIDKIDTKSVSELLMLSISNGTFPENLFKFRKLNLTLEKILMNNELKFSSPIEFNDPFDCRIVPDSNVNIEDLTLFIETNVPSISHKDALSIAKTNFENPDELAKQMRKSIEKTMNDSGICCFSKSKSNLLLWSHYSDNHKGVCLNFNLLNDLEFFSIPTIVEYQREYPKFNFLIETSSFVSKLIKTKSIDWIYEEEIRIHNVNGHGFYKFKKESLVELIFGCQSDDNEIKRIIKIAKSNGYDHLIFSKAKTKNYKYELEFEQIN
jgi:hypothetical protein